MQTTLNFVVALFASFFCVQNLAQLSAECAPSNYDIDMDKMQLRYFCNEEQNAFDNIHLCIFSNSAHTQYVYGIERSQIGNGSFFVNSIKLDKNSNISSITDEWKKLEINFYDHTRSVKIQINKRSLLGRYQSSIEQNERFFKCSPTDDI